MKKQTGRIDVENGVLVVISVCIVFVIWAVFATVKKQKEDQVIFMNGCLQDKKQYECDVLWSQTDASKQTRDLAIGIAAGAAIGAAAGRR